MQRSSFIAVVALGLLYGACSGNGQEDPAAEENIDSVQQRLDLPTFQNVSNSGSGSATASCPGGSKALGRGALFSSSAGYNRIYITGPSCPIPDCNPPPMTQIVVQRPNNTGSVRAVATCSETETLQYTASDSDGDKIVNCDDDEVAVGGGGVCDDTNAKLYRSRPSPDSNTSKPTGWRASCTSGKVTAQVTCVPEAGDHDFSGCYTKRRDDDDAGENISCASDEFAVGVGAYCGDGSYIDYMNMNGRDVAVGCRSNTIHAYAICCPTD